MPQSVANPVEAFDLLGRQELLFDGFDELPFGDHRGRHRHDFFTQCKGLGTITGPYGVLNLFGEILELSGVLRDVLDGGLHRLAIDEFDHLVVVGPLFVGKLELASDVLQFGLAAQCGL